MNNENAQNCWDFWNCPAETRQDCPAYQADAGKYCLFFTYNFRPKAKRGFSSCVDCPWYKKRFSDR